MRHIKAASYITTMVSEAGAEVTPWAVDRRGHSECDPIVDCRLQLLQAAQRIFSPFLRGARGQKTPVREKTVREEKDMQRLHECVKVPVRRWVNSSVTGFIRT